MRLQQTHYHFSMTRWLQNLHLFDVLLVGALLAQVPHAATVFERIADAPQDWLMRMVAIILHPLAYAIALEGATYYFVKQRHRGWAYGFALFSVLHNVAYYMPVEGFFGVTRYTFSATIVCIALPLAIAAFSEQKSKSYDVAGHTDATGTPTMPVHIDMDVDTPRLPAKPQRRTEVVTVANVPVHVPEHAADVRFVEDTSQVAQRETAIERNARLQAETVRKVEALHGLTADERRSKLLQMLRNGHANATQPELAEMFAVSVSTISRDMSILQSQLEVQ